MATLAQLPSIVVQQNQEAFVPLIEPRKFSKAVNKLRSFFLKKGFIEAHTQNRLSIMAACEDPRTIAQYKYGQTAWPLPQTGQMWLEYELLSDPSLQGVFCVSTSYRNEPNPIEGRHNRIFPMFEFELKGGINELMNLEKELLTDLGFHKGANGFPEGNYEALAEELNTSIIESEDERTIEEKYGPVFFLKNFPERTNPFWNMKRNGNLSNKVDVLLHGMETIGSAERSCDANEQRTAFYSIEKGEYAKKLFALFGQERVEKELEDFLSFDFFERSGGGIGITRMIRALELSNII